jgi:acyl-CoA:acyl-CoA alkyltransferase
VSHFLPTQYVTTHEVEAIIKKHSRVHFSDWIIETILWTHARYWTAEDEYSSTLALGAVRVLLNTHPHVLDTIDLVIYASATQDCIEPSTACIVMEELWLTCPSFDVKNACNSVMSALSVAHGFIQSGQYQKILICGGETPSKSIQRHHENMESLKESFSSFGFGDCGIAMMIEAEKSDLDRTRGVLSFYACTEPNKRQESTILWWWSRFPHDVTHNYFLGNPVGLKDFFLTEGVDSIALQCAAHNREYEDIDHVLIHQVSHESYFTAIENLGIPEEKYTKIYEDYGNIASCALPLQLTHCGLHAGERYLFIWLWAGATLWTMLYQH